MEKTRYITEDEYLVHLPAEELPLLRRLKAEYDPLSFLSAAFFYLHPDEIPSFLVEFVAFCHQTTRDPRYELSQFLKDVAEPSSQERMYWERTLTGVLRNR